MEEEPRFACRPCICDLRLAADKRVPRSEWFRYPDDLRDHMRRVHHVEMDPAWPSWPSFLKEAQNCAEGFIVAWTLRTFRDPETVEFELWCLACGGVSTEPTHIMASHCPHCGATYQNHHGTEALERHYNRAGILWRTM